MNTLEFKKQPFVDYIISYKQTFSIEDIHLHADLQGLLQPLHCQQLSTDSRLVSWLSCQHFRPVCRLPPQDVCSHHHELSSLEVMAACGQWHAGAHAGLGQVGRSWPSLCRGREQVEGKDALEETLFSFHLGTVSAEL